jgi:WD40 repeat protein/tetratricopeptide (TPR) repeat protein
VNLSQFRRIERVCDAFEAELLAGKRPAIEERLTLVPEEDRERLRADLLRLEKHYLAAEKDTGGPAEATATEEVPTDAAPFPVVAGYEILSELGKGGMGVVYKARQSALNRVVALKLIAFHLEQLGAGREEVVRRFRLEAEAIARLSHPNVVQVFEVGDLAGVPYLALEFVEGGTLAARLAGTPLAAADAAALVQTLSQAVQAAHERGVVHRDLKPENVLLTTDGTPKVTDFGLAKMADPATAGRSEGDAVVGTPSYMAPEQARPGSHEIGPAADVWALGAILYACLTGRPPFLAATTIDTLLLVATAEPVAPLLLNAKVPRDLETICLKCLRKEPEKRYASAKDLADDLGRFLAGEPIRARRVGAAERAVKWVRRHPAPATAAALILATVVTAFALVMSSRNQAVEAKVSALELAQEKADLAEKNGRLARDNDDKAKANARLASKEHELRLKVQRQAANAVFTDGLHSFERGDTSRGALLMAHALGLADQAKAADLVQECRTRLGLWHSRSPAVKMLLPHSGEVLAVAFSPDGRRILTGCADRTAVLWDTASGQPFGEPIRPAGRRPFSRGDIGHRQDDPPKHQDEVLAVAFSPDGRTIALGSGDPSFRGRFLARDDSRLSGLIPRLAPGTGGSDRGLPGLGLPGRFGGLGRSIPALLPRARLLWDTATGKPLDVALYGEMTWAVAFSPDGRTVVTGGGSYHKGPGKSLPGHGRMPNLEGRGMSLEDRPRPGIACLWDVAGGKSLGLLSHRDAILAVAFSPDGGRILTGGADHTAQLWDAKACRPIGKRLVHDGPVVAVAFSPDGRTFLTSSQRFAAQGTVQLWNADTGETIRQLPHPRPVLSGAFSPDGRTVLTGSGDTSGKGAAHLWSVATGRPLGQPLPHPGPVHALAWSPDGRHAVTGCADKVARLWEVNGIPAVVRVGHHETVIASTPDGSRLLLGTQARDGSRCEKFSLVEAGARLAGPAPEPPRKARCLLSLAPGTPGQTAFTPDGRRLLLESGDIYLVDVGNGKLLGRFEKPNGTIEALAISPDGHTGLAGTSQAHRKQGEAIFWDARTGKLSGSLPCEAPIRSVSFSPTDGTAAIGTGVTGTAQGEVLLLDVKTRRVLHLLAHQGPVRVVLFSPDGRTLASASDDRTARLWDVASGKPRGAALAHAAPVRALAFSSDSAMLLTGSDDQTAQLWNTSTGKPVGGRLQHQGAVRGVAISPDGRLLATASDDQTARLWEAGTDRPVDEPLLHQNPVVSVSFGVDGRSLLTRSVATNRRGWRMVAGVKEHWVGVVWQSTARTWALPGPAQGDPVSVLLRAQLATGMVLDAESRLRPLDATAWREGRKRLGQQADAGPTAAALREWHRRQARDAEAAGEWFSVGWHLERLGNDEPTDEELHLRRGRAYALSGRWRQAVDELTKALRPGDLQAAGWFFRGRAHFELGEHDKALADFSEAIKALGRRAIALNEPRPPDAWVYFFQRARACYQLRQWDKVIADLSRVIEWNPTHGPSWHGRGVAYAEQGELKRAAADFAAAVQRPNVPAEAWWDLAHARLHLGDVKGYREACSRALERFGVRFGADPVLAANLAWVCSLAEGGTANPEQVVLLASGASNGRASYLGQRAEGAALYRAGKFKEAIERFTAALERRKKPAPTVWLFLAMAHQRLKQPEEAKPWLAKARKRIEELKRHKPGEGENKAPWKERLALTLLQREAENLLQGKSDGP